MIIIIITGFTATFSKTLFLKQFSLKTKFHISSISSAMIKLLQKAVQQHNHHHDQSTAQSCSLALTDLDLQVSIHYGIPATASLLAFDPIQRLLAIATLDGRIKVIGGDGIEALLISPTQLPYKHLEFLQNQGLLVSISNDNDIQVWDLESRNIACSLQWECNITAFAVISGTCFIYIGDEYGSMYVVKYDSEDNTLLALPYHVSANCLSEASGLSALDQQPIIGVLPQPCSSGNRVLIAYANGLIILWDVSDARILFVGGGKDLQLKDGTIGHETDVDTDDSNKHSNHLLEEKEISALCWASSNGSILAVGYIDGDILFWKTSSSSFIDEGQQSGSSSSNVVNIQLSSAERRLPVIVLHWSASDRPTNEGDGRLFVYGGDAIGSEEVLTVLTLEWSSRMETLRCASRVDLKLTGSFADMILLPTAGPTGGNHKASLSVLTSPGQLHLYEDASLSTLLSQKEKKESAFALEFPAVVPTADPPMTIAKFMALPTGGKASKILSEIVPLKKHGSPPAQSGGAKWPLTGGVPSQLSLTEHTGVERVYIAGYQDGSVRLWNATYPVLSLICIAEGELQGMKIPGFNGPVKNLDLCCITLSLAVGNERGVVSIYDLNGSAGDTDLHLVSETKHEVHSLPQGKGPPCKAIFSLVDSPIGALQFANSGAKLAVGFGCGRVAVLDTSSFSILFFTDSLSSSTSPIISFSWIDYANDYGLVESPKPSEAKSPANSREEVLFLLTKDAILNIINGDNGSVISSLPWHPKNKSNAISMYIIEGNTLTEKHHEKLSGQDADIENATTHKNASTGTSTHSSEHHSPSVSALNRERLMESFFLLCCEDSLRLYLAKNVIQGNRKAIYKVKHAKPCCWTSPLRKNGKVCGLVLLFSTGVIEIRSFPGLELVKESSIMSILRWNFKPNMEKLLSSDNGQITLVNGCELAFISLLSGENCFRIPESLPCLHDKVLAAAADAAFSFSSNQKKKQGPKPGILSGIVKGFKGGRIDDLLDITPSPKANCSHLEGVFSRPLFSDSSETVPDDQEVIELNIDDIEIDESPLPISTTSREANNTKREKETEREQLLGETADVKPRLRTAEEIRAKYRKAGDASSAAADAKNKLLERQEKLERISQRTAELQNGAEDFASLANELVKAMEKRKWYHI